MAWSDPKTWTADDLLTASDLNQYVSDNLSALYNLVQGGGRKNLLHNGAMQVHQRGTSAAGKTVSDYYTADRWRVGLSNLGTWTQSIENDAPTGSGFRKSLKMLITANAESPNPGAADYAFVYQIIEGQNLQSVKKGTASAEPLTLSFWTKSNKTGVYTVLLQDVTNSRQVGATYTVDASATWEQQTITFPADTTGAIGNVDTGEFNVVFGLAYGSNRTSGTLPATWTATATTDFGPGQTNLADTNNNYWMMTGAQLEVGSASTGYEFKDYGTELRECQRYYEVGTVNSLGYGLAGNYAGQLVSYAVTKRSASVTMTQTSTVNVNCGATPGSVSYANGFMTYRTVTATTAYQFTETWTASADL